VKLENPQSMSILLLAVLGRQFFSKQSCTRRPPSPELPLQGPSESDYTLFMPLVLFPRVPTIFGVEANSVSDDIMKMADNANVYWLRSFYITGRRSNPKKAFTTGTWSMKIRSTWRINMDLN